MYPYGSSMILCVHLSSQLIIGNFILFVRDSYLAEFGILEITLLKDNQLRLVYLGYILVIVADFNMNCMTWNLQSLE